jgi:signal transduction histidine kinase
MPSRRTEPDRSGPGWGLELAGGLTAFVQRLNTRLVMAIASVALISLLISAIAINQILPAYFADQSSQRLDSAMNATQILLEELATSAREQNENNLIIRELRVALVYQQTAELAVRAIIPATIRIYEGPNRLVATAQPSAQDEERLEADGLRADPIGGERRRRLTLNMPVGLEDISFEVVISEPFTNREATLGQVRSALAGSGVVALVASLILGLLVARRVAAPITRLRRVASAFAAGDLDVRARTSGVLEVDELADQFNVMADQLAGTLRMLEADRDRLREFVADVSHELRTPIAALRMYNELHRTGQVDDETRVEFLERAADQIHRLEWLSTNLLDLSRIDAGIFPLDMREGDLREPLRAVVEAHAEEAEQRGLSLTSAVPATSVELRFDRERVVQLLTNLVGNALKFTPRGGAISVGLEEDRDRARIEVRDTGPGIRPEELPRIFDRFYRGTNTGEARASGSGLGLAIVRSIVEMHGGRIGVASVVGQGTVFSIELPRERDAEAHTDREEPRAASATGARREVEGS